MTNVKFGSGKYAEQRFVGGDERDGATRGQRHISRIVSRTLVLACQGERVFRQGLHCHWPQAQSHKIGDVLLGGGGWVSKAPHVFPQDVGALNEKEVRDVKMNRRLIAEVCEQRVGAVGQRLIEKELDAHVGVNNAIEIVAQWRSPLAVLA